MLPAGGGDTASAPAPSPAISGTVPAEADGQAAAGGTLPLSNWGIRGDFTALPMAALMAKHPQLAPQQAGFEAAASQAKPPLPPQLLVALCLQESSCGTNVGSYGGPFQFTDDGAWRQFGPPGGDRNVMADAAVGAANYIAYLLAQNGQDLSLALRGYNGPVSQGGLPSYPADIQRWMQGIMVYGDGV